MRNLIRAYPYIYLLTELKVVAISVKMDYGYHIVPNSALQDLAHLRSDLAKLTSYIANLEKRIAQWRELSVSFADDTRAISIELRECIVGRDQLMSQINEIEHKINCEIIRGIHLICV